jgi:CRP-like cAMP-binding protein
MQLLLLLEGSVTLERSQQGSRHIAVARPGSLLGATSFLCSSPTAESFTAATTCTVLAVSNEELKNILEASPAAYLDLLFAASKALGYYIRRFVSLGLNRVWTRSGDIVYQQGVAADCMFVVISGRVRLVTRHKSKAPVHVEEEVARGQAIGAIWAISNNVHDTSAIAVRDTELVRISRESFEVRAQQELSPRARGERSERVRNQAITRTHAPDMHICWQARARTHTRHHSCCRAALRPQMHADVLRACRSSRALRLRLRPSCCRRWRRGCSTRDACACPARCTGQRACGECCRAPAARRAAASAARRARASSAATSPPSPSCLQAPCPPSPSAHSASCAGAPPCRPLRSMHAALTTSCADARHVLAAVRTACMPQHTAALHRMSQALKMSLEQLEGSCLTLTWGTLSLWFPEVCRRLHVPFYRTKVTSWMASLEEEYRFILLEADPSEDASWAQLCVEQVPPAHLPSVRAPRVGPCARAAACVIEPHCCALHRAGILSSGACTLFAHTLPQTRSAVTVGHAGGLHSTRGCRAWHPSHLSRRARHRVAAAVSACDGTSHKPDRTPHQPECAVQQDELAGRVRRQRL